MIPPDPDSLTGFLSGQDRHRRGAAGRRDDVTINRVIGPCILGGK